MGPLIGAMVFAVDAHAVFWVNAVCVLAAAGHLLAHRERGPGPAAAPPRTRTRTRPRTRTRAPLAERTRFWTVFGLSLPIQLGYALPSVFVSTYVIVGLGLPGYWAGIVFTVNALGIVLFEVPLNVRMARVGSLPTLLTGYTLAGAGFLLMAQASTWPSSWRPSSPCCSPAPAAPACRVPSPERPSAPAALLLVAARTHPYAWHKEEHCIGLEANGNEEFFDLVDPLLADPAHTYTHRWTPEDLLLRKTATTYHVATDLPPGVSRTVHRVSVAAA